MRWLQPRPDRTANAWAPSSFSARQRGHALFVLGDAVAVKSHPYDRDPASGSGNCWCGRHKGSSLHLIVLHPDDEGGA